MSRNRLRTLHLSQLDGQLRRFEPLRGEKLPHGGWIRAIRNALGLTASQLGRRLGVSQGTVSSLERRESEGAATIAAVRRAAEALDCDLVYVLLPRKGLAEARALQAHVAARELIRTVDQSMQLEAQGVGPEGTTSQIAETADQLLRSWSARIWDSTAQAR